MAELILHTPEVEELITAVRELVAVLQEQSKPVKIEPQIGLNVVTGEMPAAVTETALPATETAVESTAAEAPRGLPVNAPTYNLEDIAQAAARLADTSPENRQSALDLLKRFGVNSMKDIPQEQYGSFVMALRELGAAI